jgi:ACS family allantoate permease-like MFS transporter
VQDLRTESTNHYHCSNRVPWIVIGICYLSCPFLLLIIRFILARENKKRDAEPVDEAFEEVYIEQVTADGKRIEVKVDKVRPSMLLKMPQV